MIELLTESIILFVVIIGIVSVIFSLKSAFLQAKEDEKLRRKGTSWLRNMVAKKYQRDEEDLDSRKKQFRYTSNAFLLMTFMTIMILLLGVLLTVLE